MTTTKELIQNRNRAVSARSAEESTESGSSHNSYLRMIRAASAYRPMSRKSSSSRSRSKSESESKNSFKDLELVMNAPLEDMVQVLRKMSSRERKGSDMQEFIKVWKQEQKYSQSRQQELQQKLLELTSAGSINTEEEEKEIKGDTMEMLSGGKPEKIKKNLHNMDRNRHRRWEPPKDINFSGLRGYQQDQPQQPKPRKSRGNSIKRMAGLGMAALAVVGLGLAAAVLTGGLAIPIEIGLGLVIAGLYGTATLGIYEANKRFWERSESAQRIGQEDDKAEETSRSGEYKADEGRSVSSVTERETDEERSVSPATEQETKMEAMNLGLLGKDVLLEDDELTLDSEELKLMLEKEELTSEEEEKLTPEEKQLTSEEEVSYSRMPPGAQQRIDLLSKKINSTTRSEADKRKFIGQRKNIISQESQWHYYDLISL